jgi:hypothetical protein
VMPDNALTTIVLITDGRSAGGNHQVCKDWQIILPIFLSTKIIIFRKTEDCLTQPLKNNLLVKITLQQFFVWAITIQNKTLLIS